MLRTAGETGEGCSPGILTNVVARNMLNHNFLPSYEWLCRKVLEGVDWDWKKEQTWLYRWLREIEEREWLAGLWIGVFGEAAPEGGIFDSEVAFVNRVDAELFPVDLQMMDDMLGAMEGSTLQFGIPIYGFGVPWEVMGGPVELDSWDMPMVMAVHASGMCDENELFLLMHRNNVDVMMDWSMIWWEEQGMDPPVLTWPLDRERTMERLRRLPAPLDGLVGVYAGVVKETGSVFFDWPGGYWQCEYTHLDCFCWCPECVRVLAEMFEQVEDDVRRLRAYYLWWLTANADERRRVVDVLVGLEGDDGE